MFSQILKLIPRTDFERAVKETRAERHARGFSSWQQFVAMLFCQLGRAQSLREITQGLASCEGKLAHLGIEAPARASLAYANAHRPWQLFERIYFLLFERIQTETPLRRRFRFKNKLVSLDSTVIDLCVSLFDWAKFRRTKGAIKLHLLLDHDGYLPCFGVVTDGKTHDVNVAKTLSFEPGTVLVEDRGYRDFDLFSRWTEQGVYFVTRMHDNIRYEVVQSRANAPQPEVLADELIRLTGTIGQQKCPHLLRRIEFYSVETDHVLVFLTNQMSWAASTIAAIYKDRWQIELFFKAIKQNLRIKTFVGTSANAVKIQIWSALIAMLLLRFLQRRSRYGWSLSNLVALLRMNLFTHRDIWAWLNEPFATPPQVATAPQQHAFAFA